MRKVIVFLLLVAVSSVAFAQDTLINLRGKQIIANVLEITPTHIQYRKSNNLNGPKIIVNTDDIVVIKYANGTVDSLNDAGDKAHKARLSMPERGKSDAEDHYRKYKGATSTTLLTTIFTGGIVGLIPAIACSSTPPADKRLGFPDSVLMKNPEYNAAYRKQAKRIKSKKVWGNYVTGIIVDLGVGLVLAVF